MNRYLKDGMGNPGADGYAPTNKASEREHQRWKEKKIAEETEQKIIEHTERATKTKAVYVDEELHYIPITEAIKLGLIKKRLDK